MIWVTDTFFVLVHMSLSLSLYLRPLKVEIHRSKVSTDGLHSMFLFTFMSNLWKNIVFVFALNFLGGGWIHKTDLGSGHLLCQREDCAFSPGETTHIFFHQVRCLISFTNLVAHTNLRGSPCTTYQRMWIICQMLYATVYTSCEYV